MHVMRVLTAGASLNGRNIWNGIYERVRLSKDIILQATNNMNYQIQRRSHFHAIVDLHSQDEIY